MVGMTSVKPIPEGFHTVTPVLAVEGGVEALGFYERAFGAEVRLKLVMGGKLMHSELQIGTSIVCVSRLRKWSESPGVKTCVLSSSRRNARV